MAAVVVLVTSVVMSVWRCTCESVCYFC